MRLFLCVCMLVLTCATRAIAQPLKPGDSIPPLVLSHLYNSPLSSIQVSSLRGKLVILDFWDTSCLGCILSFPEMDSLQKQFGDKIQIILINNQDSSTTAAFFAKRKKIIVPDLPFVTGDKLLNKLFPHSGVPFHVWIDQHGKVLYQLKSWNTNAITISKFLSTGSVQVENAPTKRKYIGTMIDSSFINSINYYSYLSRYIPGFHLRVLRNDTNHIQLAYNCESVTELYKYAYAENGKYDFDRPGRVDVATQNNDQYIEPSTNDFRFAVWVDNYSYNYDLYLPASRKGEIYDLMKEDLKRYFGLKAIVTKTPVKCLTLVRTGTADLLATKGGIPKNTFLQSDVRSVEIDSVREIINKPFSIFSDRLQTLVEFNFKVPYNDETGYTGNIDFKMDGKDMDTITMESLRKILKGYGLDLIEKTCRMPVLHISDH